MLNLGLLLDGWDDGLINVAGKEVSLDVVGISVDDLVIVVAWSTVTFVVDVAVSISEVVSVHVVVSETDLLVVVESGIDIISVVDVSISKIAETSSEGTKRSRLNLLVLLVTLLTKSDIVGEIGGLRGNCSFTDGAWDSSAAGITGFFSGHSCEQQGNRCVFHNCFLSSNC